jgi:hypothetical protein
MYALRIPVLIALAVAACQPLPEQPAGQSSNARPEVTLEPAAAFDQAPPVLRLSVALPESSPDRAEDVLLVSGKLSDYHLGRIKKRDLPQTLVGRILPAVSWLDGAALIIAPSAPLAAAESYTLASPTHGRIVELRVASEGPPLLTRLWPPAASGKGSERLLYCGETPISLLESELWLEPGRLEASLVPEPEGCVAVSPRTAPEPGARLVPPPLVSGHALDPSPIEHAEHAPPADAACAPTELRFGPGCVLVEDDRALVRSTSEPMLWIASGPGIEALEPVAADGRWVLRGLVPASELPIALTVLDLSGRPRSANVTLHTAAAQPRLVLSEVLANPLGPEPGQEWVEVVNDGLLPVELAGWTLEDVGGVSELPQAVLAPGEYALIVRDDFVLDDGLDVVPAPGTTIVRVPQLGKNGLSNTGEPLALRAPDGALVSRFPAFPKPKAGISVARRRPWDLDDVPGAFGHHASPGASPGAPNQL